MQLRSPERATPGRAQRSLVNEAALKATWDILKSICSSPEVVPCDKVAPNVEKELKPSVFAVAQGKETCAFEANQLATIIIIFTGTRRPLRCEVFPSSAIRHLRDG